MAKDAITNNNDDNNKNGKNDKPAGAQHTSLGEKRFKDQTAEREYNREAKRRAYALELDNTDKLILFRSTHGYWKMGGVSALEFYYNIAEQAGYARTVINSDTDYYNKFADGVISIKDLGRFDQRMAKLNITFDHEDDGVRLYNLGRTISRKDIESMRNERRALLQRANQNALPKVMNAELYAKLKSLLRTTYIKVKKMDPVDREFLGDRTLQAMRKMLQYYSSYCNSGKADVQSLYNMRKIVDVLLADSLMYIETGIWDPRKCISMYQDQIVDIKTLLNKELSAK